MRHVVRILIVWRFFERIVDNICSGNQELFWAGRPDFLHTLIQVCLLMDGILWSYNATVEESSSPVLAAIDGVLGAMCLCCVVSVIMSHAVTTVRVFRVPISSAVVEMNRLCVIHFFGLGGCILLLAHHIVCLLTLKAIGVIRNDALLSTKSAQDVAAGVVDERIKQHASKHYDNPHVADHH